MKPFRAGTSTRWVFEPAAGRLLVESDHAPGAPAVVVLSHGTWTRYYAGSPDAIGREFRTEHAVYTIVGVAPPGFDGTVEDDVVEFFIPLELYEPRSVRTDRRSRPSWVIGRLKPGSSMASAQAEAESVHNRLTNEYPDVYRRWNVRVEPFGESWRERLRSGGGLLFAAAALLLMIAAVNVGCLLLARVLDRRRELAIRAALGAEGRRLAAQLFTEALVLVAAGGALGVFAGPWLLDTFLSISPLGRLTLPRYLRIEPDITSLALALGTLGVAGLLAGTAPALLGRRVMPADVLREGGRGTVGGFSEKRWRAALVAGETALTLVVLVAGGLLVRSYERLSTMDVGFDRDRIARLAVTLSPSDYGNQTRLPVVFERLQRELATVPGTTRVGLVYPTLPPWDGYRSRLRLDGVELPQAPDGVQVGTHLIDEGLLPMLGVPILAGRNIEAADGRAETPVAIVSHSLAMIFGGPDRALGRTVTFTEADMGMPEGACRVVGVAGNVAYDGLVSEDTRRFVYDRTADPRAARYDVYVPLARYPISVVSIGASTSGDPATLLEPLRRRIGEIAPASAVHWVSAMGDEIASEYAPTRFYTVLVVAFSSSALALTSIGLFALLSHAAARRTGEMGLRQALGASRWSTARLLLQGSLQPVVVGVVAGIALGALVSRTMAGLLFGIGSLDLVSFAASTGALLVVTLLAGLVPARRVARIDPVVALRNE